jgi:subtilisin family serine protease
MDHVINAGLTINPDQSAADWNFDFDTKKTEDIFFTLSNLKRDLDLYITKKNSDGNIIQVGNKIANIANSTNDGIRDENIFLRLSPGYYMAYVRENNGANASFGPLKSPEDYTFTLKLDTKSFGLNSNLPNDPLLDYQWYLFNTGVLNDNLVKIDSEYDGSIATPNVDIVAPEAWKLRNDGSQAILAIIDQGVDLEHPDLVNNLWTNVGEIAGNGIDDDKNGFIDDIHGWNFAENISTIKKGHHGTHVAGIAAASGNNGIGISGVAWNAKIMSLDVFPSDASADVKDIVPAIYYAVNNGAKVINMSLGEIFKTNPGSDLQQIMPKYIQAFEYAKANDVFIAIAAGNSGGALDDLTNWQQIGDLDRYASGPNSLNRIFSNVATVIATESTNQKAGYSSYGLATSIAAPGGDQSKKIDVYMPNPWEAGDPITAEVNFGILSTVPVGTGDNKFGGNYDFDMGTSMASPVIAGMATLIRSANSSISAQDTLAILRAGATSEPSLASVVKGGLTANLYNSLQIAEHWTGAGDLLKLQQSEDTPVINLKFLTDGALTVKGTTTVSRSASFDPITGFYKAIDAFGSVYDGLGNIVRPGDKHYAAIALNEANIISSISGISIGDETSVINQFSITESTFLAPYAKVEGNTWFAFEEANSDGFAHFKLLGANQFGLEDAKGGGDLDFNDHIITFAVDTLI